MLEDISIHGLKTALTTRTLPSRILWALVFLTSLASFITCFGLLLDRYHGYETVEKITIEAGAQPFPAVTLCNLNAYKRNALANVPELIALNEAYKEIINELMPTTNGKTNSKSKCENPNDIENNSTCGNSRRKRSTTSCASVSNLVLCGTQTIHNASSSSQCCTDCVSQSTCVAWFYGESNSHCHLKQSTSCGYTSNSLYVAGNKSIDSCYTHNIDFRNAMYPVDTQPSSNAGLCCSLCWDEPWCVVWSFDSYALVCYLMSQITTNITTAGVVSGVVFKTISTTVTSTKRTTILTATSTTAITMRRTTTIRATSTTTKTMRKTTTITGTSIITKMTTLTTTKIAISTTATSTKRTTILVATSSTAITMRRTTSIRAISTTTTTARRTTTIRARSSTTTTTRSTTTITATNITTTTTRKTTTITSTSATTTTVRGTTKMSTKTTTTVSLVSRTISETINTTTAMAISKNATTAIIMTTTTTASITTLTLISTTMTMTTGTTTNIATSRTTTTVTSTTAKLTRSTSIMTAAITTTVIATRTNTAMSTRTTTIKASSTTITMLTSTNTTISTIKSTTKPTTGTTTTRATIKSATNTTTTPVAGKTTTISATSYTATVTSLFTTATSKASITLTTLATELESTTTNIILTHISTNTLTILPNKIAVTTTNAARVISAISAPILISTIAVVLTESTYAVPIKTKITTKQNKTTSKLKVSIIPSSIPIEETKNSKQLMITTISTRITSLTINLVAKTTIAIKQSEEISVANVISQKITTDTADFNIKSYDIDSTKFEESNGGYDFSEAAAKCHPSDCQNGGVCETNRDNFSGCRCAPGFKGEQCQSETIECSVQCRNSDGCVEGPLSYKCLCKAGFTGINCTTDIDECASNPCVAGQSCYNGANMYLCIEKAKVAEAKEIVLHDLSSENIYDGQEQPKMTHQALAASVKEMTTFILGSRSDEELLDMAFGLEETISHCSFGGEDCMLMWSMFHHRSYGNCFTFNNDIKNQTIATRSGPSDGMQFMVYANPEDYLDTADTVGLRITFHEPGQKPFPDNDGRNVLPGYINNFALSYNELKLLHHPYSKCVANISELDVYYYNQSYSIPACENSFIQEKTIEICGCGNPKWPQPHNVHACTYVQKLCAENVSTTYNGDHHCYQGCFAGYYSVKSLIAKQKSGGVMDLESSRGVGKVVIYFRKMSSMSIQQSKAYPLSSLFSNLGGIMGLTLGASVISCVEMLYSILTFMGILRRKLNSRSMIKT